MSNPEHDTDSEPDADRTPKTILPGRIYRVVDADARIISRRYRKDSFDTTGYWEHTTHTLSPGDRVRYRGKRRGVGHDNVEHDSFELVDSDEEDAEIGVIGEFRPNYWGQVEREALAELEGEDTDDEEDA